MGFIFKIYIKDLLTDIHEIRKKIITIGRHIDNDIILKGESISRFHAEIAIMSGYQLEVREKSVNGTFVNGDRVNEQYLLKANDHLTIGPYKIVPEKKVLSAKAPNISEDHSKTVMIDSNDDKLKTFLANNYSISCREYEIIQQLLNGQSSKEISKKLFISFYTVKTHVQHIFEKMGLSKRTQLVGKVLDIKNEINS